MKGNSLNESPFYIFTGLFFGEVMGNSIGASCRSCVSARFSFLPLLAKIYFSITTTGLFNPG